MSIVSITFIFLFYTFSSGLKTFGKIVKNLDEIQNLRIALSRISEEIKISKGADSSSTSSKLVLNYGGYTISYYLKDGKIQRSKGGATPLTEDIVKSLNFDYSTLKLINIRLKTSLPDGEAGNLELATWSYARNE